MFEQYNLADQLPAGPVTCEIYQLSAANLLKRYSSVGLDCSSLPDDAFRLPQAKTTKRK